MDKKGHSDENGRFILCKGRIFKILVGAGGYEEIQKQYKKLPDVVQKESRIQYYYLKALGCSGDWEEVYNYLTENPEYMLDDLREGEDSISELWREAYIKAQGHIPEEAPKQWDFDAL